ncbi:MAG: LacI family DNA-binding transcriptional regulator [Chitinophagaceae bacterium]|nr:LacI family DNA-binding transcriptional regulator [Chitinophagaceae bacterium]
MQNKIPTIQEMARILKLSKSTVSRALRNHPAIGLRTTQQVQKLAKELNYEPNQMAISFSKKKTMSIGVIVSSLDVYFHKAVFGIEDCAYANDYNVLISQTRDEYDIEKKVLETMRKQRVDGIVASISRNAPDIEHFEKCKQYNIPVVFFDRVPDVPNINSVWCRLDISTVELVSYLVSKGHEKIALINGPDTLPIKNERLKGYYDGHIKNGLKVHEHFIKVADLSTVGTYEAMDQLLSHRVKPSAIITFNDYMSLDAMHYLRKVKPGRYPDIDFVTYSNLPTTRYLDRPPLAYVDQFPYEQGKLATEVLFRQLNGLAHPETTPPENLIIESKLVIY